MNVVRMDVKNSECSYSDNMGLSLGRQVKVKGNSTWQH